MTQEKYIVCEKCKTKRNITIAKECPICVIRKIELEIKEKEINKKKYNGFRLYRAKKARERMAR